MKAEMSVGNGMGRVAPVSRTSGKAGRVAQIFTTRAAIITAPAAMPQPRNDYPVARPAAGHTLPQRGDNPANLKARNDRTLGRPFAIKKATSCPADTPGGTDRKS